MRLNAMSLQDGDDPCGSEALHRLTCFVAEYSPIIWFRLAVAIEAQPLEDGLKSLSWDGHFAGLLTLRGLSPESDEPPLHIEVVPAKGQHFPASHPRVEGRDNHAPQ